MSIEQQRVLGDMLNRSLEFCFPNFAHASSRLTLEEDFLDHIGHVMLTVSGLDFRVVILLHINMSKDAASVYSAIRQQERSDSQESDRLAFYTESGNHMCGEIKRYLYKQFSFLGMSTPNVLSVSTDITDLKGDNLQAEAHQYYIDGSRFLFGGSLYLYAQAPLALSLDIRQVEEVFETGELEFF
jgi:hypothetical protein